MAQHGYLHDSYDRDDFGRGDDDRERSSRGRDDDRSWRGRDEERGWRGGESGWSDRDHERGSMFGWRDQDRHSGGRHDHDQGFFDRAGDEVSSWVGGDDHDRGRGQDRYSGGRSQWQNRSQGDLHSDRQQSGYGRSGQHSAFTSGSDWNQGNQRYSAHPDDHYRSWRDKQVQALDQDYQDYCREREQQFHSDFDTWRQNRQSQGQSSGGQGSMSQGSAGQSEGGALSTEAMELDQRANRGGEVEGATTSAMGAATMGTNNSENTESAPSATGRKR